MTIRAPSATTIGRSEHNPTKSIHAARREKLINTIVRLHYIFAKASHLADTVILRWGSRENPPKYFLLHRSWTFLGAALECSPDQARQPHPPPSRVISARHTPTPIAHRASAATASRRVIVSENEKEQLPVRYIGYEPLCTPYRPATAVVPLLRPARARRRHVLAGQGPRHPRKDSGLRFRLINSSSITLYLFIVDEK
jgi:hypothetical protein